MRVVVDAAPPPDASNTERVRWEFEVLNRHEVSSLREHLWTADTVGRFPDKAVRGPQEMGDYLESQFAALAGWHMDVVAVAGEGDDVFVRWHLTGTHTGPMFGVEATGRSIAIDGVDHFVLRDGKVASVVVTTDGMELARQLGLLPKDGSPADKALKAAFNTKTRLAQRVMREVRSRRHRRGRS